MTRAAVTDYLVAAVLALSQAGYLLPNYDMCIGM